MLKRAILILGVVAYICFAGCLGGESYHKLTSPDGMVELYYTDNVPEFVAQKFLEYESQDSKKTPHCIFGLFT